MKAKLTLEDGRVIDITLTPEQQKAIEVKKTGRWKPNKGETYYFPEVSNSVGPYEHEWVNDSADNNFYKHGLIFKTEEEAQFYIDKQEFIVKVNDRIDELNDGWIPDWSDSKWKYGLCFYCGNIIKTQSIDTKYAVQFHYMKSEEVADTIINEFKDDLMKYIFN